MRPTLDRLREVRLDWRHGRRFGYPSCCIALYCWDRLWNLPPALTRCCSQGVDPPESVCGWVPCGVIHGGGSDLSPVERSRRIVAFWISALRPAAPLWRRSARDPQAPRPPWVPRAESIWPIDADFALSARPGPAEAAYAELDAALCESELDWD